MLAPYRGRFAPSPTGSMHLGLGRTALLAYLRARSQGGAFVLRIEDIDVPRVVPGAAEALARDLRFLGLDWDEGPDVGGPCAPYAQSERLARYAEAVERLRGLGLAYPCSCSRKEVALASAPHGPSEFGAVYPGTCREGPTRPGVPCCLRFRTPDPLPSFEEGLDRRLTPPVAQGDFVLQRADGVFNYQLAVVVDDIAMGITEVVRGQDLSGCTGWQLALYDALGAPRPAFVHVPLLLDRDGKRLAKRDATTSIRSLHERGVSAAEIVGALAHSAGLLDTPQPVMPRELIAQFSLERVRYAASSLPPTWVATAHAR